MHAAGDCLAMMRLVFVVVMTVLVAGCGSSSPSAPTASVPFSTTDLRVGTGAEAVAGKRLTVNYTGWLYDPNQTSKKGTIFGTSVGATPFVFVLGSGGVIGGWDQGLPGMKVGGLRQLVIPPDLAYGATGNGPVPPNATLLFEVELLALAD
jgi:FKBP-type peptidyl-prolyl cis-trans isomerase FkpA